MKKISILGAGAWGSAIASLLLPSGDFVTLIGSQSAIDSDRVRRLKSIDNSNLKVICYDGLKECCKEQDMLIIAVPSQAVRELMLRYRPYFLRMMDVDLYRDELEGCLPIDDGLLTSNEGTTCKERRFTMLIAAKGMEYESGKFMHELLDECFADYRDYFEIAVISGPNFASEILDGMIAITTIGCNNYDVAKSVASCFTSNKFLTKPFGDLKSVEIVGVLKNVYAIANGMLAFCKLGKNTEAAMLYCSMLEMSRIIQVLGGDARVIMEPAGVGDFYLTSTNDLSRNMSFGREVIDYIETMGDKLTGLDREARLRAYLKGKTVEGYYSIKSIYKLLKDAGCMGGSDFVILNELYKMFYLEGEISRVAVLNLVERFKI